MGEMQIIQGGIATTIHLDGSVSSSPVDLCDQCDTYQPRQGGLSIQVVGGEEVVWLCSQCRG
jgi:hypothetical protein